MARRLEDLVRNVWHAASLALAGALVASPALGDYDSHPELEPAERCVTARDANGDGSLTFAEAGIDPIHCQRLFWDLPAVTALGVEAVGLPFDEDPIPRFPGGITDRPPPLYILDATGDGTSDDGQGYERPGPGRVRLCANPDEVPWWRPLETEDYQPIIGTDPNRHSVDDPSQLQSGPLFRVECRRGTRAYFGPWQVGTDPAVYDRLAEIQSIRMENTDRLDNDVAAGRTTPENRVEWSLASEYYNHFASHHGTCYNGNDPTCSDPNNPQPREAFDPENPDAACRDYQRSADCDDDPMGDAGCCARDEDPECTDGAPSQALRNGTQVPGRLTITFPEGRGIKTVEDHLWGCSHHVVTQLPPGSYGIDRLADYRQQKGGLVNSTNHDIYGAAPGEVIGGSVGEMVAQNFTEPANVDVKPINFAFNVVADLATTYYAPFTWNYHESHWFPPYDAAIAGTTIHSHHRMVKGTMNLAGGNPPRLQSYDPECGGWAGSTVPPTDLYTNWYWEDAKVCGYYKDADGPVVIRKGQALRTTCYVNNGVTPEAIKHGLVAGNAVQALKVLGAPIPDYPETVPASTWGDALAESPVGRQLLYGTHPPVNYRVVYKCSNYLPDVPGATLLTTPENIGDVNTICAPNPAVDADLDYIDGPYESACGLCQPGSIAFACIGEDEMCIGVAAYYALPRLGNPESNDEAMANLQEGNVNEVGTPGALIPSDVVVGGLCHDCEPGL